MNSPILKIAHITAAYGSKTILCDASLEIHHHDFIIINGPNGGGKTTLLKIIAGLLQPKEGSVTFKQGLIIGYLPQYRGIDRDFPITVRETVLSGLNCRKSIWKSFSREQIQTVNEALKSFHLEDLAERPINSLSGGQWQRTLLARSLAGNPDLWLLDEPDTHLDAESQEYLHKRIEHEVGKRAIVIVTHNPESLSYIPNKKFCHVESHQLTAL